MGWISSVVHTISHTASEAGHAISHTANQAGHAIVHAANDVGHETTTIVDAAGNEATSMAETLAKAGLTATQAVTKGASWAGTTLEKGAEKTEEGLVAAGKFISENACSIAIGTALGTVVAAASADGEEEGTMAALAIAVKAASIAEIQTASTLVSSGIVDAVWEIPEVSSSGASKTTAKQVIKYTIVMAVKENSSEIALTGGQYLVGAFLTVLTGFICSGELPGGFKVWQGAGSKF